MSRLLHSFEGFLRAMQISSTGLFIFVEGKLSDSYFYGQICKSIPDLRFPYEIHLAQQLTKGTGGKQALLSYFVFLRKNNALVSSLTGQKTTCIFFVDKDVDDLQHKKKRSQHLVYTEHYDVQNYIFLHGDLQTGAASAASVDPARLSVQLSDAPVWCLNVAKLWREWISLCLCMLEKGISGEANYKVHSRVQKGFSEPTDAKMYATFTEDIAHRAGLSVEELNLQLTTTTKKVDGYFARSLHHKIFKGKWFAVVLAAEVEKFMAGKPYDNNGLARRLPSSIAATLDFREPWADYFRNAINRVTELL